MTLSQLRTKLAEEYTQNEDELRHIDPSLCKMVQCFERAAYLYGFDAAIQTVRDAEVKPIREALAHIRNKTIIWSRDSEDQSHLLKAIGEISRAALAEQEKRESE